MTKDDIIYFGQNNVDDRKANLNTVSVGFTIGFNGAR